MKILILENRWIKKIFFYQKNPDSGDNKINGDPAEISIILKSSVLGCCKQVQK